MALAGLVYVLIYFLLINDLREDAAVLSAFCDTLQPGMTDMDIRQQAARAGFETGVSPLRQPDQQLLFISDSNNSAASCRLIIIDNQMHQKHFSLMLF